MSEDVFDLATYPVHLGLGAVAVKQEAFRFTGPDWYAGYGARHAADGLEGRLVSLHTFAEPWTTWEMHPSGHEVVVCITGRMTLQQELPDGSVRRCELEPGQAIINAPGVWHTADVDGPTQALFITAGTGTEVRPR
jgi:quercetin dioxygenase-like cupin family protein